MLFSNNPQILFESKMKNKDRIKETDTLFSCYLKKKEDQSQGQTHGNVFLLLYLNKSSSGESFEGFASLEAAHLSQAVCERAGRRAGKRMSRRARL